MLISICFCFTGFFFKWFQFWFYSSRRLFEISTPCGYWEQIKHTKISFQLCFPSICVIQTNNFVNNLQHIHLHTKLIWKHILSSDNYFGEKIRIIGLKVQWLLYHWCPTEIYELYSYTVDIWNYDHKNKIIQKWLTTGLTNSSTETAEMGRKQETGSQAGNQTHMACSQWWTVGPQWPSRGERHGQR